MWQTSNQAVFAGRSSSAPDLQDPAGVRCLIETAIDGLIEHLGPLTPDPSPPNKFGGEGRRK